jgi:PAS domain S-box-containing protein
MPAEATAGSALGVSELQLRVEELDGQLRSKCEEYEEALLREGATREILRVINSAAGDLALVFRVVLEKAMEVCGASFGGLWILEANRYVVAALHGVPREFADFLQRTTAVPGPDSAPWRFLRGERSVIQNVDLADEELYRSGDPQRRALVDLGGARTALHVPLCKDDNVFGVVTIYRREVRPFNEKQIALLQSFAAQAAIAMENSRLINEMRQALDQQTATAEVLEVINASPGELSPVFDAMLEKATHLCEAAFGILLTYDGDRFKHGALRSVPTAYAEFMREHPPIYGPGSAPGQLASGECLVHIVDMTDTDLYRSGDPNRRAIADLAGARTLVAVPLRKDNALLGAIVVFRQEVRPFADNQIALLQSFAAQAVIAMENARLLTETREALEQQTATAEVLEVINTSPSDVAPVFEAMLDKAMRLCEAAFGALFLFDKDRFIPAALHGVPAAYRAFLTANTMLPGPGTAPYRFLRDGERSVIEETDLAESGAYRAGDPQRCALVDIGGAHSAIQVPLCKDAAVLGVMTLYRQEVRPFTGKQIGLLQNFAAHAVIAINNVRLFDEVQARAQDLSEALEQQTATSEILGTISGSPGKLEPVFLSILANAIRLCGARYGGLFLYKDGQFRVGVLHGAPPAYAEAWQREPTFSVQDHPHFPLSRLAATRQVVHIHDVAAERLFQERDERYIALLDSAGARTMLVVPMLKDDELIGAIVIYGREARPFTDKQIALLGSFAAQAVIAIENARLLGELQDRTRDLEESLEYQTATSDVLKVISRSTFDLQSVLDTLSVTAARLCMAEQAYLTRREGEEYRFVTAVGSTPETTRNAVRFKEDVLDHRTFRAGRESITGRVIAEAQVVQIVDVAADAEYAISEISTIGRIRTLLGVPMMREGAVIGTMSLGRERVEPFTEKQIDLVKTFADQAVIAIENARLLTETREALEQQTATAEVLQVINSSPGDLAPVFEAVLDKALSLCGAAFGILWTFDGEFVHAAAIRGATPAYAEFLTSTPHRPGVDNAHGRLLRGEEFVHIADVAADAAYHSEDPVRRATIESGGARTLLAVALRKGSVVLGFFVIYRRDVRLFAEKQISLLQNFAAQAVIAMENARLITETREALERQTATAELLQTINASPGNLTPVFETMLAKAHALCGVTYGSLQLYDGEKFYAVAVHGLPEPVADRLSQGYAPGPNLPAHRLLDGEDCVHVRDLAEIDDPIARNVVEAGGMRTVLFVALRKDGRLLGMIVAARKEVQSFADKEVSLLANFAAQAVIAMENAGLLTEQREALEQQTATADVLGVINSSPGDLAPVFDAMLEKATRLCEAAYGVLWTYDGNSFLGAASRGVPSELVEFLREPQIPAPGTGIGRLLAGEPYVHWEDLKESEVYRSSHIARAVADLGGARTNVLVPLRSDAAILGAFSIYRQEVRPFSGKQIALLQNLAAQAVIAMENARLLDELRQRTGELARSVDELTATGDVLKIISRSSVDLETVLDTLVDRIVRLCRADQAQMFQLRDDRYVLAASRGLSDEAEAFITTHPIEPIRGTLSGRVSLERRPIHIVDVLEDPEYTYREGQTIAGFRTMLGLPLLREDTLIGIFIVNRTHVEPFTDKEIELATTFADQAVIAIENARLFEEIRQRQAELRVTFDNMGDGVAMFDASLRLAAWNRNFQQIIGLSEEWLARRPTYAEYLGLLAERGEFGTDNVEAELANRLADTERELRLERTLANGTVIEVRRNAVPGDGFVLIYSDITERKRSEEKIRAARDVAEIALKELKTAQASLIHAEKMASLGQLTAGIAHEIKNPLNFVNNFAGLSVELLEELKEAMASVRKAMNDDRRTEIDETIELLNTNLDKIASHGRRADGIVKSMLLHSRGGSSDRQTVDINALLEEALNLAYHGARAQDQNFNVTLERDLQSDIAPIEIVPQDMTRVFLNLIGNAFYAVGKRRRQEGEAFRSTVKVTTRDQPEAVEIAIRDNGIGIPPQHRQRLFQPFFTTKPTGEGTGLGLSISYDIVTQQHGGTIVVDSELGQFTEFRVRLPRRGQAATAAGRPA